MKLNLMSLAVGAICMVKLFVPEPLFAQGAIYFSNLGQISAGTNFVGHDNLTVEVQFLTGTNGGGYTLNSVQILLLDASAASTPSSLGDFGVDIHAADPGLPVNTLAGNSNPLTGGTNSYVPTSAVTLLPDTIYWLSLSAFGVRAGNDYYWSYAATDVGSGSSDGWSLGSLYSSSGQASGFPQFAILATPLSTVPEPSQWSLMAVGLAAFLVVHFHRASSAK
jgi:hypothetical protein